MVLGAGLNGLGVIRSLARAGVPVIAVDDNMNRPAMRTR
jgi:UDP-N-acetylmuramoylalanine-D-glutamate ligase